MSQKRSHQYGKEYMKEYTVLAQGIHRVRGSDCKRKTLKYSHLQDIIFREKFILDSIEELLKEKCTWHENNPFS